MICDAAADNRRAVRFCLLSYSRRMHGWVRMVVVWLLVLALPAQGAAAATMALCSLNHHGMAGYAQRNDHGRAEPARSAARSLQERHSARGHLGAEPCHTTQQPQKAPLSAGARTSADAAAGAVSAATDVAALKLVHADQHNCSACATCASAAAFSSVVVKVPALAVSRTVSSSPAPSVERFVSDGPDRPPRPLLV